MCLGLSLIVMATFSRHWATEHIDVPFRWMKNIHFVSESMGRGIMSITIIMSVTPSCSWSPWDSSEGWVHLWALAPLCFLPHTLSWLYIVTFSSSTFLDRAPFLHFGIPHIPCAPPWLSFLPSWLILLNCPTCVMLGESNPDTAKSQTGRAEWGWSEKKESKQTPNPTMCGVECLIPALPNCLQTPDGLKAVSKKNTRLWLLTSLLADSHHLF